MSSRVVEYGAVRMPQRVRVRRGVAALLGGVIRWWWQGWRLWAGMVADAQTWDSPARPRRDHGR